VLQFDLISKLKYSLALLETGGKKEKNIRNHKKGKREKSKL
jgi:hypothetical protein